MPYMQFKARNIAKTAASPSEFLRKMWDEATQLGDGERMAIPFETREDAVKAQRWTFRERKRLKADMLAQRVTGDAMDDPDTADAWRGLVTSIEGSSLIIKRPRPPKHFIVTKADGSTRKIKV